MNRCISRKDYLKKGNSDVAYSLYVQDNIRKDDYARLNTGEIVKAIGIWENELNKKAIYYDNAYGDWFDAIAVENFSENIIDLIEVGDYVNGYKVTDFYLDYFNGNDRREKPKRFAVIVDRFCNNHIKEDEIEIILTHEQYEQNCYKIDTKQQT